MAVDLYKDDFSRVPDADVFNAIEAFTRISEPLAVRPRESFVLDFKEDWSDGALHTVDGFAHTFGGLLIVGVSEINGQPDAMVGVESPGELKTRIASSIATNISPTPPYDIAECNHPTAPGRKLAVVRVRASHQIHYCTKKGSRPIYVRNEDQSPPADAAQLRLLIERKTSEPMGQSVAVERVNVLRPGVNLRRTIALNKNAGVPTTLQILVVPFEHPGMTLDSSVEQQFRKLVNANFLFRYRDSEVEREEERWVDYYDWRWFRASDTHESVWRITSSGDLVYARQARVQLSNFNTPVWSLGDTIADLLLFLAVVRSMWKSYSYYGEGHLLVGLGAHELQLHTELVAEIRKPSQPGVWYALENFNSALRDSVVSSAVQTTGGASATAVFNSGLPYDAMSDTVAHLLNQLLRSLTYAADLSTLRHAVECFFELAKA